MLIHVVKPRDTLWQISLNYRVSLTKIVDVNGLKDPNQLVIGQSLVIPTEDALYTVKAGDTLWQIAQAFGTNIYAIIQANKIINPAYIYPGLKLYIPAFSHTVKRGETLWQIAQRYSVALQKLLKVNDIENPNAIYNGMVLVIPRNLRPVIEVNAYTYERGEEAVATLKKDGKYLTYYTPFAYLIKEDGSLKPIKDVPGINVAISMDVVPMMAITNFTSTEKGENLAHIILDSIEIQNTLIANVINIMNKKDYQGLNIDFENVLPEDRKLYNQFLQRAVDRLHLEGFFVSTALAPKVSAEQTGLLYEAHDYEFHGKIADFVVLMTYEWGWRKGPPRAISPIDEIISVLNYGVSAIPRNKIFFGFQIYARDWLLPHVSGQEAETFSWQEAEQRAARYGAVIQYDPIAQSPFYRYSDEQGERHEVWFEDARSAQAKFDVVKDYDLRGISYWVLGYPFPQNWVLLEDNFTIEKLL